MKSKTQYLKFVLTYNLILLIPLLIINLSVLDMLKKYQYNKVSDEVQMTFERQDIFLKNEMAAIKNFTDECKFNKIYNDLYFDKPNVYFEIEENLKEQEKKSSFIDRVYMYDEQENMVFSSNGTFSADLFFEKICKSNQLDFEKLKQMAGHVLAFPASLQGEQSEGILFATAMYTWTKDGAEMKYFLFPVRNRKLKAQFVFQEEEKIILLNQEEILYATDNIKGNYREVLEDDRYYVWEKQMNCGFRYIRMIPKYFVTKSMYIYLKGYSLWALCSLLVGILLAGVFSKKRYDNYLKLLRHNEALKEERDVLRAESCLYELLQRKICQQDEVWKKCLECNIRIDRKYKFYVLVSAQILDKKEDYEWFVQQMNQSGDFDAYRMELVEGILVYLVCTDGQKQELEQKINIFMKKKNMQIGISDPTTNVGELRQSYQQAKMRMYAKDGEKGTCQYPSREVESLKIAVENHDSIRACLLIDELLDVVEIADMTMGSAVLWDVSGIFQVDRNYLLEEQKSSRDDLKSFSINFLKKMKQEAEKFPKQETEKATRYKKRDIVDVLDYIYENYLDENFSVKSMASHFQTSVSNISHFFKKNMDVTISQYVEQIKLEKAKELLQNSDEKISEIAVHLRYANSTAFIEMFKKYEGITPGMYREKAREK